jgi:hypothetical protein
MFVIIADNPSDIRAPSELSDTQEVRAISSAISTSPLAIALRTAASSSKPSLIIEVIDLLKS